MFSYTKYISYIYIVKIQLRSLTKKKMIMEANKFNNQTSKNMKKFNAASYQRKVTNYKNRRKAVRQSLYTYIEEVVKEGAVTFKEPLDVTVAGFKIESLHWSKCPIEFVPGEFHEEGIVAKVDVKGSILQGTYPLGKDKSMDHLMMIATAIESETHSPFPLDETAKEIETLHAIAKKEKKEMCDWIEEALKEVGEVRFSEELETSLMMFNIIGVAYTSAKKIGGARGEKEEQVCLLYMDSNKLCGSFVAKQQMANCTRSLSGLLKLAKAIDSVINTNVVVATR